MKTNRLLALSTAVGFAAIVPLAAQAGGQSDRANRERITVTGCLDRNTASASTTTSTAGATTTAGTSGAEQFVLIKASPAPAGTGSGGFRPNSSGRPWYFLLGDRAQLRGDVRKVVEVQGTLDSEVTVAAAENGRDNPPAGTIRVTSIKVVSGSCGE